MPGTHSKWVRLEDGRITAFSTFMTGEIYAVMAKHSILAHSVAGAEGDPGDAAFREAVLAGHDEPALLTSRMFSVRGGQLLFADSPGRSAARLSGLVIGAELAGSGCKAGSAPVRLVVSGKLAAPLSLRPDSHRRHGRGDRRGPRRAQRPDARRRRARADRQGKASGMTQVPWPTMRRSLVAILRGIRPDDIEASIEVLAEAGFTAIEIPLNSPDPFRSIELAARVAPAGCLIGAGTVLKPEDVDRLNDAGGRLVVSPNTVPAVIERARTTSAW